MKRLLIPVLLIMAGMQIESCNDVKLSDDDAKALVIKTMNLPKHNTFMVERRRSMMSGFVIQGLEQAGLVTERQLTQDEFMSDQSRIPNDLTITEAGKSSFINQDNSGYYFKTYDEEFDRITGILINKEQKTATVRFTTKATNVTPAAIALSKTDAGFSGKKIISINLENPTDHELVFKKFQNGWQL